MVLKYKKNRYCNYYNIYFFEISYIKLNLLFDNSLHAPQRLRKTHKCLTKVSFIDLPTVITNTINLILNYGTTEGYRINRKFISVNQLRIKADRSIEIVEIDTLGEKVPF